MIDKLNADKRSILVVEDNPCDFEATLRSLRKAGVEGPIYHCVDGDDALKFLFRKGDYANPIDAPRPSLILLDLNLPGISGYEVLQAIKADDAIKAIPVVVLSTSNNSRDVESCYAMGANSYMTKCIDLAEFLVSIQRATDFWLEIVALPKAKK